MRSLALLAALVVTTGCPSSGGTDALDAAPLDSAARDSRGEGTRADGACQPPQPAKSNAVDTCRLSHRPKEPSHLSNKTPAATEPITIRVETQAGDVQQVFLRLWTGVARELLMTLESTSQGVDVYKAVAPPSARPIYYRFRLVDGSATLHLTASGPRSGAPTGSDDFFIAPVGGGKTLHYQTDFAQPEIWVRSGASYVKQSMVSEGAQRAGVTGIGVADQEMLFYLRDAKTGSEDHPPGGGDYRLPPTWVEGWLDRGTLFDVEPTTLSLGLLDVHTHPYDRVSSSFVYDPTPLTTLLPGQGIDRALTMVDGTIAYQKSKLVALHQAHRWLVPLVWVNPTSHTVGDVEDLLDSGFRGLKFHPVVDSYPADGAAMDPFLVLAAKHRVPVQIHSATDDVAKPSRIIALAKRHPQVAVIMIHTELGAVDKTATLGLIKSTTNVYAETSWSNATSVLQAMSVLDSSRTLFGTDSTVDGMQMFTNQSIPNPQGQYVYTVAQTMALVKAQANAAAYDNWAHLTAIRLYGWSFRPDPDLYDTDGDGLPDVSDPDDDNDGKPDAADPKPRDPGA
jgi:hypothetical protein